MLEQPKRKKYGLRGMPSTIPMKLHTRRLRTLHCHDQLFVQIINLSPSDGGSHWLTLSNIYCLENTIKVYDSANSDLLQYEEELTIASLVATKANKLQVIFPNVTLQTNGYDCGLYAFANATALRFGRDPTTQTYIPRMTRSHLYKCLENKHLQPFPIKKKNNIEMFLIYLYFV